MLLRLAVLLSPVTLRATMLHARGDAQMIGVAGADQSGDGRAVLRGGGQRVGGVGGEVVAGDDLGAGPEAAAQSRVVVVDSGVDHGDRHAGAVDAVGRPSGGGADDRVEGGRRFPSRSCRRAARRASAAGGCGMPRAVDVRPGQAADMNCESSGRVRA